MVSRNVLYYGQEEAPEQGRPLRAGPLSLIFQHGSLRRICLGEHEVLRRIYVAVRDANWGTVPASITNLNVAASEDMFRITYDADNLQGSIHFRWSAIITGDREGRLTFSIDGTALTTFHKNRIGLCALHPIAECAGLPCAVERNSGAIEKASFPLHISPHQPFRDIRAISHEVQPGVLAEVRFSGDTFEMEDQRNWTDASFKTYSTPLDLPFPVEVPAGMRISQAVTLSLRGQVPSAPRRAETALLTFGFDEERRSPLPGIGLALPTESSARTPAEIERLRGLHLSHLRVDLLCGTADCGAHLERAAEQSSALGVPLEVALFLSDNAQRELDQLREPLRRLQPWVVRWLIFHCGEKCTQARWVALARASLAEQSRAAAFVSGTNAYFTELNRAGSDVGHLGGVCFSLNPQVHASDNETLVENLPAQAWVVENARRFVGKFPVFVTPVTLKPRFNPSATGASKAAAVGKLPSQVDPRQMSLFGAAWTVGSLKHLSQGGAAGITYYETAGWRGVMESAGGSLLPDRFSSIPGSVFPLYHVLADAGEFAGGYVLNSTSSHPLEVEGIVLEAGERCRILLANLTSQPKQVRTWVTGQANRFTVKRLDENNAEYAMTGPEAFRAEVGISAEAGNGWLEIEMRPYATARIDWRQA